MIVLKWFVFSLTVFKLCFCDQTKNKCGNKDMASGFIRNGDSSNDNEWPWLAKLKKVDQIKFFCAGTLVMAKKVVTAAHCLKNKGANKALGSNEVVVQLGSFEWNVKSKRTRSFQPREMIIHPDWDSTVDCFDADIALLLTDEDILSLWISPICWSGWIQSESVEEVEGTVVGWGFTEDGTDLNEEIVRQVRVKRVTPEKCFLRDTELSEISSERTFCVKGVQEGAGPCRGDSGS